MPGPPRRVAAVSRHVYEPQLLGSSAAPIRTNAPNSTMKSPAAISAVSQGWFQIEPVNRLKTENRPTRPSDLAAADGAVVLRASTRRCPCRSMRRSTNRRQNVPANVKANIKPEAENGDRRGAEAVPAGRCGHDQPLDHSSKEFDRNDS